MFWNGDLQLSKFIIEAPVNFSENQSKQMM